jgi:hypothetical protein
MLTVAHVGGRYLMHNGGLTRWSMTTKPRAK